MIEVFNVSIHFLRPNWFYAFIPFALLLYFAFNHSINSVSWKKICDAKLLPHILISKATKRSYLPIILLGLASILSITAAAGPVWKKLPTPVFRDQSSLIIAVDLSRSMDASDIKPTRLERAKLKLIDILAERKGGQTALVVYAANAFTVTPLTSDTSTIENLINALDTEMMPAQGSNVADALKASTKLLSQAGEPQGDILLITDSVRQRDFYAITELANKGHRLSILGVGTPNGGPIVLKSGFLQDSDGAIVIPKLDVLSLQKAALAGHGLFVGMQTSDKDIKILSELFSQNKTSTETVEVELTADIWHEEGPWLLLIVLPLVALISRRGLLILITAIILPVPEPAYALEANELWLNPDQRAMQHFDKGEHKDAAALFKKNNWKASALYRNGEYEKSIELLEQSEEEPNSDAMYNKANALAKLQRYEEAIEAYDEAEKLDPNNEDAIYNRELVKKKLEEQDQQQDKDKDQQDENKQEQDKNKDKEKDKQDDQKPSDEEGEKSEDEKSQDGHEADKESEEDKQDKASDKSADNQDKSDKQESQPEPEEKKEEQAKEDNESEAQNLQQKDAIEDSEERKANEQWLKRIVDDPGGLLRRKFKYQYQNMPGQKQSKQPW